MAFIFQCFNTTAYLHNKFILFMLLWAITQTINLKAQTNLSYDYDKYETEKVSAQRIVIPFRYPVAPRDWQEQGSNDGSPILQGTPETVTLEEDPLLKVFINRHIEINKRLQVEPGFRIQIFAGSSREEAENVKLKFAQSFSEMASYITHEEPYYKVRVGDYLKKDEADKNLRTFRTVFPQAFVVRDQIRVPKYRQ